MNASLTCSAEGTPIPTLTWIKVLTPNSSKTVKVESGKESVLDLIGVTEENFGVYLCEAINIAGTTISHRAVVLGWYSLIICLSNPAFESWLLLSNH